MWVEARQKKSKTLKVSHVVPKTANLTHMLEKFSTEQKHDQNQTPQKKWWLWTILKDKNLNKGQDSVQVRVKMKTRSIKIQNPTLRPI